MATTLRNQSIICFAGEDWWFHNPHSNLHLMQAWSADNRILFVNSPGIRMPDFKTDKFACKRVCKKLGSLLRFVRKAQPNIWVLTPLAIPVVPRFQVAITAFNSRVLALQVRLLMLLLKLGQPIVWVTVLVAKDVALELRRAGGRCLVYYCVDNTPHYPGVDQRFMVQLENELHAGADLALFVNRALLDERRGFNPNTHHTGHGVDYEHFAQAQAGGPLPDDMAHIPRPIAGYMGEINSLDIELLEFLARRNPGVSFVFIGDIYADMARVQALPNVHFLGKRPYARLPDYLRGFDVCCLYYRTDATFNNYRNPKKLLEYMATGKPIVSVSILEVEHFRDYVHIAASYAHYEQLLRQALNGSEPAVLRQRRIDYARQHTWGRVADDIGERIAQVLQGA